MMRLQSGTSRPHKRPKRATLSDLDVERLQAAFNSFLNLRRVKWLALAGSHGSTEEVDIDDFWNCVTSLDRNERSLLSPHIDRERDMISREISDPTRMITAGDVEHALDARTVSIVPPAGENENISDEEYITVNLSNESEDSEDEQDSRGGIAHQNQDSEQSLRQRMVQFINDSILFSENTGDIPQILDAFLMEPNRAANLYAIIQIIQREEARSGDDGDAAVINDTRTPTVATGLPFPDMQRHFEFSPLLSRRFSVEVAGALLDFMAGDDDSDVSSEYGNISGYVEAFSGDPAGRNQSAGSQSRRHLTVIERAPRIRLEDETESESEDSDSWGDNAEGYMMEAEFDTGEEFNPYARIMKLFHSVVIGGIWSYDFKTGARFLAHNGNIYKYAVSKRTDDHRTSNRSLRRPTCANQSLQVLQIQSSVLPINVETAYLDWERHDKTTLGEIVPPHSDFLVKQGDEEKYDGGLRRPCDSDSRTINRIGFASDTVEPPSSTLRDGLTATYVSSILLMGGDSFCSYKNNLSAVISGPSFSTLFILACGSVLVFAELHQLEERPRDTAIYSFNSAPPSTGGADRLSSTDPEHPHNINNLQVYDDWLGQQVLVACVDDGRVLIWNSTTLNAQLQEHRNDSGDDEHINDNDIVSRCSPTVPPDFELRLQKSAWGVDLSLYEDDQGQQHYVTATSDNSRRVRAFYYHAVDRQFYDVGYGELLHNIPEVSFVSHEVHNSKHVLVVAAASISGQIATFSFVYQIGEGPISKQQCVLLSGKTHYCWDFVRLQRLEVPLAVAKTICDRLNRVRLLETKTLNCTVFSEDCWTVKALHPRYFLDVQSLRAMTGDPDISEEVEVRNIINESMTLGYQCDPVVSSHLGFAAGYQFYGTPVFQPWLSQSMRERQLIDSHVTAPNEDYHRIRAGYVSYSRQFGPQKPEKSPSEGWFKAVDTFTNAPFLVVTTSQRACLLRSEDLFCNSSTLKVVGSETVFARSFLTAYARLGISHVIPELLCLVVVSPLGVVSIFRLCHYRGVYGMRQEHILPGEVETPRGPRNTMRIIIGVALQRVSSGPDCPRYRLHISDSGGRVVTFELSAPTFSISDELGLL